MRFSAISSRVKSCVSISTLDGSLEIMVGAVVEREVERVCDELQRKTLPMDGNQDVEELGMAAGLRDSARSLSTAALRR